MTPPTWFRDLGGADPYLLLRVTGDANREQVIRAYRRRIRELHPDLATGDADEARLVNLARDILLDPVRRDEYDRLANEPEPPPPASSAWDTEDVVIGTDPPPPSAWETEDVVVGAAPSAAPPQPPPYPPPGYYQPYPHPPPGYYQPYRAYPVAPQPSRGLPVAALLCSFFFAPLGLVLGIDALRQHRHVPGTGRQMAITAIVMSAAVLVVVFVCCGGLFLSALQNETT